VFKGLINDVKAAAASFVATYLARVSVAVPFLVALGFATAAIALELTERFGARNALWMLAGGFCAIGLLAAFAVTLKEQQEEMQAAEEQQRSEGGIGEMTSAAASEAATQLPAALLSAFMQNPSGLSSLSGLSELPVARTVSRHMPLLLLLLLVGLLLWPTEQTDEAAAPAGEQPPAPGPESAEATASEDGQLREAA
jgi:hypothetical protein